MDKCDCQQDQFCSRYQREMTGRFREICQGINVDMGTAAAFRAQWLREVGMATPASMGTPSPLLLRTDQMPGDAVAMTAAIYSLHKTYPGKYVTAVESQWPEVFTHNPDVTPPIADSKPLHMHYPAIHACNERGIHFMQAWCEHLSAALGVPIPLQTNRPHLYFPRPDDDGYGDSPIEDYWIVCSGGKRDFTTKLWGWKNYQEVINILRGKVRFIQVGAKEDCHFPHHGAEKMVGKTTLRQLFDLVRRARGVLCGISLLMHVAAAIERPAVVIAGGREPVQWNSYPKQTYVHTIGALPCRSTQGHIGHACWRSRVAPLGDGSFYDRDTCERPVAGLPLCMGIIAPDEIARLVMRYNDFVR